MAKTTITVDSSVRDRLAVLARHHRRPLGDELAALLDEAEGKLFWERVSAGYARPYEPADTPYDAADEFPEYAELAGREPLPTPDDLVDDMPEHPVGQAAA